MSGSPRSGPPGLVHFILPPICLLLKRCTGLKADERRWAPHYISTRSGSNEINMYASVNEIMDNETWVSSDNQAINIPSHGWNKNAARPSVFRWHDESQTERYTRLYLRCTFTRRLNVPWSNNVKREPRPGACQPFAPRCYGDRSILNKTISDFIQHYNTYRAQISPEFTQREGLKWVNFRWLSMCAYLVYEEQ